MDLKYTHKSKKALANLQELSADRESAIHTIIIHYLYKYVQSGLDFIK